MSETDEEFLSRLQPSWPGTNDSVRLPMSDFNRLFALARRGADAAAEIERLKVKNIQMQAALGYAICADDERHIIPENPFKCGICDANKGLRAEVERLRAALRFYADADNYKPRAEAFGDGMYAPRVILDAGYDARAALKEDGDA